MYYTVYKITNKINGKIYIGKHKTNDLDDGYFGSGKVLRHAIKKHGIENFIKEYIEIFDNEEDMNVLESKLVNPTFVANSSTYNLKLGGEGGWDYVNNKQLSYCYTNPSLHKERYTDSFKNGTYSLSERLKLDSSFRSNFSNKTSQGLKQFYKLGGLNGFKDKKHSNETKSKIKATMQKNNHQKGEKNSQFGTCWINNGVANKKISKKDIDIWIEQGYNKGKISS